MKNRPQGFMTTRRSMTMELIVSRKDSITALEEKIKLLKEMQG